MSHLEEIETRHGWDRWKDVFFIGVAALLTALAIGSVTSKAAGKPVEHAWSVKVVDDNGASIDQAAATIAQPAEVTR